MTERQKKLLEAKKNAERIANAAVSLSSRGVVSSGPAPTAVPDAWTLERDGLLPLYSPRRSGEEKSTREVPRYSEWGLFRDKRDMVEQYNLSRRDWRDPDYMSDMKTTFLTNPRDFPLSLEEWEALAAVSERVDLLATWDDVVSPLVWEGERYANAFADPRSLRLLRFDYRTVLPSKLRPRVKIEDLAAVLMEEQDRGTVTCAYQAVNNLFGGSLISPTKYYQACSALPQVAYELDEFRRAVNARILDAARRKKVSPDSGVEVDVSQDVRMGSVETVQMLMMAHGVCLLNVSVQPGDLALLDDPLVSSVLKFVGGFAILDRIACDGGGHFMSVLFYPGQTVKESGLVEDLGFVEDEARALSKELDGSWMVLNGLKIPKEEAESRGAHVSGGSTVVRRSKRLSDILGELKDRAGTLSIPLLPDVEPGTASFSRSGSKASRVLSALIKIAARLDRGILPLPQFYEVLRSLSTSPTLLSSASELDAFCSRKEFQAPLPVEMEKELAAILFELFSSLPFQEGFSGRAIPEGSSVGGAFLDSLSALRASLCRRVFFVSDFRELAAVKLCFYCFLLMEDRAKTLVPREKDASQDARACLALALEVVRILCRYLSMDALRLFDATAPAVGSKTSRLGASMREWASAELESGLAKEGRGKLSLENVSRVPLLAKNRTEDSESVLRSARTVTRESFRAFVETHACLIAEFSRVQRSLGLSSGESVREALNRDACKPFPKALDPVLWELAERSESLEDGVLLKPPPQRPEGATDAILEGAGSQRETFESMVKYASFWDRLPEGLAFDRGVDVRTRPFFASPRDARF